LLERLLARWTARIVSLTDGETADCLQRRIGRPNQYRTIPSGVRLGDFSNIPASEGAAFRAEQQIAPDALVFLSTGRLTAVKGFDVLLRSFWKFAETSAAPAVLVIVGDGEERPGLERLAQDLGIAARLRFCGFRANIRPALRAADVFVLASRNEGMGRSLIEAMAAGLPVIASRVGGIPCFVEHMTTGILVDPGDTEGFAAAMNTLASGVEARLTLGRRGCKAIDPEYDELTMVSRLAEVYESVLRETSSRTTAGIRVRVPAGEFRLTGPHP